MEKSPASLEQINEKLECLSSSIDKLDAKMDNILIERLPAIREDIAGLKVKAGIMGALAGSSMAIFLTAGLELVLKFLH